ncbi:hypothetical protein NO263_09065 [Gluconacetobacter entanii]|uniref:Uncharacterized protein n=1 Tax=Gluconacetobacter entanii TaxID=108528 RepID=A0ABT3K5N2_9PROT|nr:hypothetical protein [Gluconacetobacter entanii]MCW4590730.1 hypothetical protein [Gluconacetobacter entanii]MCW4594199.1 hypothetical protein [Gluconacetobacter entanii]NPC89040.1 hypothetical protein [Gluconacetobacter entanii]
MPEEIKFNDPWEVAAKFPNASEISDIYLSECETWANDKCNDMLKISGAAQPGLSVLIVGYLIGAQLPYWWTNGALKLDWKVLIFLGLPGIAGVFVTVYAEYFRAHPTKASAVGWESANRLRNFWKNIIDNEENIDDDLVSKKLLIFIRNDRMRRIESFQEVEAGRHKYLQRFLLLQAAGIMFLGAFTIHVLKAAHQQHVTPTNITKNTKN